MADKLNWKDDNAGGCYADAPNARYTVRRVIMGHYLVAISGYRIAPAATISAGKKIAQEHNDRGDNPQ